MRVCAAFKMTSLARLSAMTSGVPSSCLEDVFLVEYCVKTERCQRMEKGSNYSHFKDLLKKEFEELFVDCLSFSMRAHGRAPKQGLFLAPVDKFYIEQNTLVAVQPFFFMTTAC